MGSKPCPSFPCFFGKRQGKPPKKQGFFIPTEPLKSLEKKGKTPKKPRNSSQGEKNKEFQKNKERKAKEPTWICTPRLRYVLRLGVFHGGVRIRVGLFLLGALRRGLEGANLYMSVSVFWGVSRAGRCEFGRGVPSDGLRRYGLSLLKT